MKYFLIPLIFFLYTCKEDKDLNKNNEFNYTHKNIENTTQENTSCQNLPEIFENYEDAHSKIHKTKFYFIENLNTSKSSWIRGASYFSCDGKFGFLSIYTDKKEYIHQNVPIELWNSFKQAESFGRFYNKHIKHKYHLKIK